MTATAAPGAARENNALIIRDDRGGSVVARTRAIRELKASGRPVEIRGSFCLSACTLYLALPQACTEPGTVFGFHGPSSRLYGIALRPESFERWSEEMAGYYPEPVRSWFLQTARQRIVGFFRISGAELIKMGIRRCSG